MFGVLFSSKEIDNDSKMLILLVIDSILTIFEKYEIKIAKILAILSVTGYFIYTIYHWIDKFIYFKG